jgi:hypothetical protein
MAYLEEITRTGQRIVDVFLIGMLPTVHEMTVYLADGSKPVYYIEADTKTVMAHYRQAIEYSGYGPRGLQNRAASDDNVRCRVLGCHHAPCHRERGQRRRILNDGTVRVIFGFYLICG